MPLGCIGGPINASTSARVECNGTIPRQASFCAMKTVTRKAPIQTIILTLVIFTSLELGRLPKASDASKCWRCRYPFYLDQRIVEGYQVLSGLRLRSMR